MLDGITPVILTRDEEPNIGRTLERLSWAREVIVCDSGSRDATLEIARRFPNVRIVERALDTLATQWTFAVDQAKSVWVLTLDADYILPSAFVEEMSHLDGSAAGYEASFIYAINGHPLRATLYTPRAVLLRRDHSTFYMDGHTQRVRVHGQVGRLRERIVHDDRKSLRRFVDRQKRYMRDEAAKLRALPWRHANAAGRIRKLRVVAPFAVALHTLLVKRAILDGRAGWRYTLERVLAELILSRALFGSSRRP